MEADASLSEGHLSNMGRMIEDMESKLRNGLDQVKNLAFSKCILCFNFRGPFIILVSLCC